MPPRRILTVALQILISIYLFVSIAFGIKLTYVHYRLPMDFGSFIASGLLARSNDDPYSYEHPLVFKVPITDYKLIIPSPNLNPPISIIPFDVLARYSPDPILAGMILRSFSLLVYAIFAAWVVVTYSGVHKLILAIWLFALAGFWQTIEVGQIYIPLLISTYLAWRALAGGNTIRAGVLMGALIAVKPQFGLWALSMLLIGEYAAFLSTSITVVVISLLPLFLFEPRVYGQWIAAIGKYDGILLPGNMSILGPLSHIGFKTTGLLLSGLVCIVLLLFIWRNKPPALQTSYLAILLTNFISPYSWSGYTLFLLPELLNTMKPSGKFIAGTLLLAFPLPFVLEYYTNSALHSVTIGWVYGWAILLLLWDCLETTRRLRNEVMVKNDTPTALS